MEVPKRVESIGIVAVCLVYVSVRLWGLGDSCLWFDEIFSVHAAEHTWAGMWWFVAQDLIHPPLFYALLKLWVAIGGDGVFWLRLFPVLFSFLTVVPFLQICRELKLGTETKIWALLLFAANGAMIKYSQEVRMYELLLFFSTVSLWLFLRFFYRGKNFWLLTLTNVLLVYTHYFGWLIVLSEVALIGFLQRIKVRHLLGMLAILLGSYVPWVVTILKAVNAGNQVSQNIAWIERPNLHSLIQLAFDLVEPFYFQQSNVEPTSIYAVSVPLVVVLLLALLVFVVQRTSGEHRDRLVILVVLTFVPVAVAVIFSWLSPYSVWGARHLIVIFVPTMLLVGICLTELRPRWVRLVVQGVALAVVIAAFAVWSARPKGDYIWCAWNDVGDAIESTPAETKRIVVFEDLGAYHIWFSLRDRGDVAVQVLEGVPTIQQDTAYFLPRGFEDVKRSKLGDPLPQEFYFAYRTSGFESSAEPVRSLSSLGFVVSSPVLFQRGGQTVMVMKAEHAPN